MEGKVAIVTGSSAGIGAACALQLARGGARVVVNYVQSEAEAEQVRAGCEQAGAEAVVVQGDVAADDDCCRIARAALDRWGRIDWLVNNAGTTMFAKHADLDALQAEDFQRIYGVNVVGAYQMIRACAASMREHGEGAVVNVSSIAGVVGIGSSVAYAASKGALNTMTIDLARALAPAIRVNAVCPGFVETRWWRERLGDAYDETRDRFAAQTPLGHVVSPEETAETIAFLLGATKVTGETLMIDGGLHLNFAPLDAR